jgi:hypothetical protein
MSQMSHSHPTMYKFFYFKIEIRTKADSYMPCKAMAHSTKYIKALYLLHLLTVHFQMIKHLLHQQKFKHLLTVAALN